MTDPLRVAVIVGSTREGRVGDKIGRWFADLAAERADLAVTTIDLLDFDFPARYPAVPTVAMREFVGLVAEAEAFVLVTPEYNRGFPASLKQAIDYPYDEWRAKPVGFVSYGYRCRGWYAVEQLRMIFTELHAVTMRDSVAIDLADCSQDALTATALLDQLGWWGLALREAKQRRPYAAT